MNTRIVLCALLAAAVVLGRGTSQARWMNPNTGRFHTMDSYDGDQGDPKTLHRYVYAANNPVNNIDPSGEDFEVAGVLAVADIGSSLFAAISPATSKATSAAISLPPLPTSKDGQLLVGLIFAESSSRNYGGGENEDEKVEMGLTVLNRTYYATQTAPNGRNYNRTFGSGTVMTAIQYPGEFVAYGGNRWNVVMSGTTLKTKPELDKLQVFEKDHLRLSIDAANFCTDGTAPLPTGLASIGDTAGQSPIAFNKAANSPPNNQRMVRFVHVGSHTFYSFRPGRETQ